MKKSAVVLVLLAVCFYASAQDSTIEKSQSAIKNDPENQALIVISGEDIRRFPSTNFLDAVNGMFPWIFSQQPVTNEFLFVVNGYVLSDINALSLYDIDKVIFSRTRMNAFAYPFTRPGTFYITTKKPVAGKPIINYNTQALVSRNKTVTPFEPAVLLPGYAATDETNNTSGYLFSNQVSLSATIKKLSVYASGQWQQQENPDLSALRLVTPSGPYFDSNEVKLKSKATNLKANLDLGYEVLHNLHVGITGSYFYGMSRENSVSKSSRMTDYRFVDTTEYSNPLQYYHLGGFASWTPIKNLRNNFWVEYSNNAFKSRQQSYSHLEINNTMISDLATISTTEPYGKNYVLRDQLEYDLLPGQKFNATARTVFSYVHDKIRSESRTASTQGGFPQGSSFSSFGGIEKITTLNPSVDLSFDGIVNGYAGYAFMLNKGFSKLSKNSKLNAYGGVSFDVKKLLQLKNRLDVGFHYADMAENNASMYWTPQTHPDEFVLGTQLGAFSQVVLIPNPSLQNLLLKNRMLAAEANSSFANGRFQFGVSWSSLQYDRLYLVPVPIGGTQVTYTVVKGNETQTGFAAYSSFKWLNNAQKFWETRLTVLFPKVKLDMGGSEPPLNRPVNYQFQTGIQNRIRINSFTAQANVLIGNNRKYYEADFNQVWVEQKLNECSLSYLELAYDFPVSKKYFFSNVTAFAQARNLFVSKDQQQLYRLNSYAGVGVNLQIN